MTKIVRFKEESVTDTSAEYAIKDELPAKRKADMNTPNAQSKLAALKTFIRQRENLLVITGAGISTASGIGDYRDQAGNWKRAQPVSHQDFLASYAAATLLGAQPTGLSILLWQRNPTAPIKPLCGWSRRVSFAA